MDKNKVRLIIALLTLFALVIVGTFAYNYLEGWSLIDSFYFTAMTLTTIGFGDLVPSSGFSKVFTSFYAFVGVGIGLFSLAVLAQFYFKEREADIIEGMMKLGIIKEEYKGLGKEKIKEIVEKTEEIEKEDYPKIGLKM